MITAHRTLLNFSKRFVLAALLSDTGEAEHTCVR